jgi:hypothetical protein
MSHIELTLKQFALLSSMSMILVQPSLAAGAIEANAAMSRTAAQPEQIVTISTKQKKHFKSATADDAFVYTFSVPFLPAIQE